jgi:glyoxylase-like metal-dependent hydrolase (beta-lactamase superfamily II)
MVRELSPGVWQFELRGVNAYLIEDEGGPTLVDAGTPMDVDDIRTGLAEAGYEPSDVGRVLLTHYDLDHVGGLAGLTPELDAPVYAHRRDAELLTGERSPPLSNHKGALQRLLGLFVTRPPLEVETVEDGDEVGEFTAYHTPGHSPGHVVFVSEEHEAALLGDLVAGDDGELEPSGWLMSYDTAEVEDSIRDLAQRAPAFEVACVGHGEPLTSGGSDALAALAARL